MSYVAVAIIAFIFGVAVGVMLIVPRNEDDPFDAEPPHEDWKDHDH